MSAVGRLQMSGKTKQNDDGPAEARAAEDVFNAVGPPDTMK